MKLELTNKKIVLIYKCNITLALGPLFGLALCRP